MFLRRNGNVVRKQWRVRGEIGGFGAVKTKGGKWTGKGLEVETMTVEGGGGIGGKQGGKSVDSSVMVQKRMFGTRVGGNRVGGVGGFNGVKWMEVEVVGGKVNGRQLGMRNLQQGEGKRGVGGIVSGLGRGGVGVGRQGGMIVHRSFMNSAVKLAADGGEKKEKEKKKEGFQLSAAHKEIMKSTAKHLWPEGNLAVKGRVMAALGLLVGAKLINIQIPQIFKELIDTMNEGLQSSPEAMVAVPAGLFLAYGAARLSASAFNELRSAVFAKVSTSAIRKVGQDTFRHLHNLDMKFHLDRNTGALSRIIDRGTRGINFMLSAMLFHMIPTFLEIGLVCGVLTTTCGPKYAGVALATIGGYTAFTLGITQWRTKFRVQMNAMDNEASSK
eukprot:TRINITY_DN374_c1_g1_i10.p2 TRINITY_DN374_c1_g1~~TRINITY_DN374_c1_g1_i10.p2  ORF type:complete len:386 (-),score=118.38 TRINITY_DN374_c1_g1_i10:1899-3056(-)